jgi:hypothetical protein
MLAVLRTLISRWFQIGSAPIHQGLTAKPSELAGSDHQQDGHAEEASEAHLVPYDETLLERSRTQWQFGDWPSLAQLEREKIQHHPDRAKLALLAAAGRLQTGNDAEAKAYIRLAQDWGVSKKLISQILIAGVHNSIGRAAAIGNQQHRALQHFEKSLAIGAPASDIRLLTSARKGSQLQQLGFPATEYKLTADFNQSLELSRHEKQKHFKKNSDYSYYRKDLENIYKIKTGLDLNLDNPVTYNEKIQWLKLFDSTSLKSRLADKYSVREWVEEKIGKEYLIPLIGVWDKFEEIEFSALPEKFVLKANHGFAWNIIIDDKSRLNIPDAKNTFDQWLNTNFAFVAGFEMHYANIKPRIIAEQYIAEIGKKLHDYKVYCFNGKAMFIGVFIDRQCNTTHAIYDREWNRVPLCFNGKLYDKKIAKPDCLDELIHLAENLSAGFIHVRVDFYILSTGIRFGEMTFTPASGWSKFEPEEYGLIFGRLIDLTQDN